MPGETNFGASIGLKVFMGLWVILFISGFIWAVGPVRTSPVFQKDFLSTAAIVIPGGVPSVFVGRFIGRKLEHAGFLRTIWVQVLCAIAWVAFSTTWLFFVIFHEKLLRFLVGHSFLGGFWHTFLEGFPIMAVLIAIILVPSTVLASGISAMLIGSRNRQVSR
jgi:hypothetical protein